MLSSWLMTRHPQQFLIAASMVLACLSGVQAAKSKSAQDPWSGKTSTDVVMLLGEPTKTRKTDDGSVLIYKLLRLEPDAVAPATMIVLDVPGIGVVARMLKDDSMRGVEISIEPTEVDKRGRGTGGGVTEQETASVTWNTDSRKIEHSWEERPAIRGKLTLKFELDPHGTIESWSVSPKKAATRP